MYRPSEPARRRCALAAALVAIGVPFAAAAGIEPGTAPAAPAAGHYQIRCWQYGRLLFEENRITLPADAAQYGIKMAGTDRHNKPIYVADTKNATCLIRNAVDAPRWPQTQPKKD